MVTKVRALPKIFGSGLAKYAANLHMGQIRLQFSTIINMDDILKKWFRMVTTSLQLISFMDIFRFWENQHLKCLKKILVPCYIIQSCARILFPDGKCTDS